MTNNSEKINVGMFPTVYIILPLYNGEKYILEQLMSIYYQNYQNRFLIIVNDWSTDSSYEIAEKFVKNYELDNKVKIITKENWWVTSAVSRWLEDLKKMTNIYTDNILISYCDDDDFWTREKLEEQVAYMQKHPECDLSYHDLVGVDENDVVMNPSLHKKAYPDDSFFYLSLISPHMWSTELMFRPKFIDSIIPMPTWFWIYQDYWTMLVITLLEWNVQFINKKLGYYRRGHSSLSTVDKTASDEQIYKSQILYFTKLKEKFPDKDISYVISYYKDKYHFRCEKKYSVFLSYTLLLLKYPKVSFLALKVILYKLFRFWSIKE